MMDRSTPEAERLDAFFDHLLHDPTTAAPPDLDAATAAIARRVVMAEQAVPPPPADVQVRVWNRVLGATRPAPVARPALWRRWPAPRVRLAGAGVLAAGLVLAGGLILSAPRPASADEILARAARVAGNSSAFGLRSYEGTVLSYSRIANDPAQIVGWQEQIWFTAPDHKRIEAAQPPVPVNALGGPPTTGLAAPALIPPAAGAADATPWIAVWDGISAWKYQATQQAVIRFLHPAPPSPGVAFEATDFQDLLRRAGEGNTVVLRGETQVGGHPAYVLDLTLGPATHLAYPPEVIRVREWIDRDTYLLLGSETYQADGTVFSRWAFTRLLINVPVDPAHFVFTPPAGVPMIEMAAGLDPVSGGPAAILQQRARAVPYTVFRLGQVPDWLAPSTDPGPDPGQAGYIVTGYNSHRGDLSIIQAPGLALGPIQAGATATVGGQPARYAEQNGTRWLVLERDGTTITLQGRGDVTREVLFTLAGTLERVPTGP